MARSRDPERRRVVRQWRRSGLSAKEFAAQVGINVRTLERWSYEMRRETAVAPSEAAAAIVEIRGAGTADDRFEVELRGGRRLRVPAAFEAEALRRLVAVLEPSS